MCVKHFVNAAQFLNTILVLASPFVTVMSPVTRIYAFEQSKRFDLMTLVSNLTVVPFSFPSPESVLF